MTDKNKSKEQLIEELIELRQRIAELEASEIGCKQTEEALRETHERLNGTLNALPDLLFEVDRYGRFYDFRAPRPELLFVPPEEFLGKTVDQVLPKEAASIIMDAIEQVVETEKNVNAVFPLEIPTGVDWFEISIAVKGDPKTPEGRFIVLSRDIAARKQTEETLRQRNRELALLNQVSQTFVSTLDLDQVLTLILEEVRRLLGVVACSIWLIDPETDELVCRQVTDPQSDIVRGWRLPKGRGLVGWVAQHGQSLNIPDTEVEERHFKGVDAQTGLVLRSILSVPLRIKKGVIGVIQIVDEVKNRFTPADLQLMESLATTAAIAIENAQLYEAAQEMQKQTQRDAETKAMLLKEVNHRVKNNLAAIAGILYIEKRHAEQSSDWRTYQTLIDDLINRIEGLATVHRLLSASEWSPLSLSELAEQVIHSALQTLPPDKQVVTTVSPSPIQVTPRQANNLAMVINELTTNIVKYALPERETVRITIHIKQEEETVLFEFRDDGPGFPVEVLDSEHWNVGMYLVQNIVCGDLRGEINLFNDHGAVTTIRFPTSVEAKSDERNER